MAQRYASMSAKDTRENSTLFDNIDATITNVQFTKEAPDNYNASGDPIYGVVYFHIDSYQQEKDETDSDYLARCTVNQSNSLGAKAGDEFTISVDGYGLIPVSDDFVATRRGSKWDTFKSSLENEGVPSGVFEAGDMSKLIGLRGHFKRVNDPARNFGASDKKSKFPPSTLLCTKVLSLPGEVPVGKVNGGAKAIPVGSGSILVSDSDLDTITGVYLLDILANAKDKRVQRSQLTLLMSKAVLAEGANGPNISRRQDIARRGADEAFIATLTEAGLVVYDPAAKPQYVTAAA